MSDFRRTLFLFAIIFIEGYVVLATELLALREVLPYAGSGTDVAAIVIAAVLMPLALGYYWGGQFRGRVRRRLMRNVLIAMTLLLPGLSYVTLDLFFKTLITEGFNHRLGLVTVYCLVFIAPAVYLLGQTAPLVCNYFSRTRLARAAGRILFFSTLGSCAGALGSTLVLMAFAGVHVTVSVTLGLLGLVALLVGGRRMPAASLYAALLTICAFILNSGAMMDELRILSDNPYNTISVTTNANGERELHLNGMASSKYRDDGTKHEYVMALENRLLGPIYWEGPVRDILIIGAGAFTFGLSDKKNNYEYVDIDETLKEISETHVLRRRLGENKKFIPMEARAFLIETEKKYDLILIDVFTGGIAVPEHLVTREFFQQVKDHLKVGGIVAMNLIAPATFDNAMSRHMDDTFRSVFPYVSREVVQPYNPWDDYAGHWIANVLYYSRILPGDPKPEIYTDDKNTLFRDKPQTY